jgi:hypothetical protein
MLPHLLTIHRGREPVVPRAEVRDDGAICREKALGMAGRLEPLHPSFPLAGGVVGDFRTIVQIAVLPMVDTGQNLA